MPEVKELEFDENNEGELRKHGIDPVQAFAVLSGTPLYVRNKRRRSAIYKVIGPDAGGTMLTVLISPTAVKGRWRPVTGWASTKGEQTLWRKSHG